MAETQSIAYPSAPISVAYSCELAAPPISTLTLFFNPAFSGAFMIGGIAVIVVVSNADVANMSALFSLAASTNFYVWTSIPMSITLKPLLDSIIPTRFLPISWMSPSTVPKTTVPFF